MSDPLIQKLRNSKRIDFSSATRAVIEGEDLTQTGNSFNGPNIYIATGSPPKIKLSQHLLGKTISVGSVESFEHCELRCTRQGKNVVVAVYTPEHEQLTRALSVTSKEDDVDEALLAWLGPLEDICTPWSDNDPAQCQVVTVEGLRRYAQEYKPKEPQS